MKKILRTDRIMNLSHNDFDGATCQVILGNVFKNIQYINSSYYRVDDILQTLNYDLYDWVFLTDISPTKAQYMDISDKIILLDHHNTAKSYHDVTKTRYVVDNMCASTLTLRFVEKYYNLKLPHLYDLVRLAGDYDMWIKSDPKCNDLNDLMFYKYRPEKFRELYMDGHTNFNDEEIKWLAERRMKFEKEYEALEVYELEKIKGCIVENREFINEVAEKLQKEEGYRIVFVRNPSHGRVSVRQNIKGFDIGTMLQEHGWGGGHAESAGLFADNLQDLERKVKILEKEIYETCEEMRR